MNVAQALAPKKFGADLSYANVKCAVENCDASNF